MMQRPMAESAENKARDVDTLLRTLNLDACRNTRIGAPSCPDRRQMAALAEVVFFFCCSENTCHCMF